VKASPADRIERPLILAHRGDWRHEPENSIGAMTAALAVAGCDGVELDVRISKDGVPVVIHDATLARVQGRPDRVDALTIDALRACGVPALGDVLSVLPQDAFLDVELKGADHGDATAAVLRSGRGEAPRRAVISSFDPAALVAMRSRLPHWRRWLNAEDLAPQTLSLAMGLGCHGVAVRWGAITPGRLREATEAGLVVVAWTVRRSSTVARLGRLGVFACCVEAEALEP
jgi:glycerophosphoryl diester phosphodiesterase